MNAFKITSINKNQYENMLDYLAYHSFDFELVDSIDKDKSELPVLKKRLMLFVSKQQVIWGKQ
jgi:hypothetical protein